MNPHLGHFFAKNRRFMAFSEVSLPALYDLRELRRPDANFHGLYFGLSNPVLLDTSAIYEQLYTTAQKVVFPSHDAIHQIEAKNTKTWLDSIFNILE